ncbi:hypothetical protein MMC09_006357 [Bachmanniomyces sp. S44760]|nr:hypothetical protein [Bachmanniomyces sp. S44760]
MTISKASIASLAVSLLACSSLLPVQALPSGYTSNDDLDRFERLRRSLDSHSIIHRRQNGSDNWQSVTNSSSLAVKIQNAMPLEVDPSIVQGPECVVPAVAQSDGTTQGGKSMPNLELLTAPFEVWEKATQEYCATYFTQWSSGNVNQKCPWATQDQSIVLLSVTDSTQQGLAYDPSGPSQSDCVALLTASYKNCPDPKKPGYSMGGYYIYQ